MDDDIIYTCQNCSIAHHRRDDDGRPQRCLYCRTATLELTNPPLDLDNIQIYYTTPDSEDDGPYIDTDKTDWELTYEQDLMNTDYLSLDITGPFPTTVDGLGIRVPGELDESFEVGVETVQHQHVQISIAPGDIVINLGALC